MPKLDTATRQVLKENRERSFGMVIQISGTATDRAEALEERGIQVRRRFRMTNSLGIQCTGDEALQLARLSWVSKIELDRPVSAFRR